MRFKQEIVQNIRNIFSTRCMLHVSVKTTRVLYVVSLVCSYAVQCWDSNRVPIAFIM